MHKPSLAQIVYNATFPRPRPSDPATFAAHIARNLVPEVRVETSTFYGSLDCIEAQYPGLNYAYGPHRLRLGRFPWHRKLFRVFDELRLTEAEILSLCRWEGTKWARLRYEKEEATIIRDTTADGILPASPTPHPTVEVHFDDGPGVDIESDITVDASDDAATIALDDRETDYVRHRSEKNLDEDDVQEGEGEVDDDYSSDDGLESCGVELNHRLLAATAARAQGVDVPLDEDWEQWLKEAGERESYTDVINAIRTGQPLTYLADMPSPIPQLGRASISQRSASLSDEFILPTSIRNSSNRPSGTAR